MNARDEAKANKAHNTSSITFDDFEYPVPKRETNWTMKQVDVGKGRAAKGAAAPHRINDVSDIDGASPGTTAWYQRKEV